MNSENNMVLYTLWQLFGMYLHITGKPYDVLFGADSDGDPWMEMIGDKDTDYEDVFETLGYYLNNSVEFSFNFPIEPYLHLFVFFSRNDQGFLCPMITLQGSIVHNAVACHIVHFLGESINYFRMVNINSKILPLQIENI